MPPVRVRGAFLSLLLIAQWQPLYWIDWVQLIGTTAMVLCNYCFLARFVSLMPWNRKALFSSRLLLRTFLSAPVSGNIPQGLPAA